VRTRLPAGGAVQRAQQPQRGGRAALLAEPKLYGGELSVLVVCVSPGAQLLDAAEHAVFAAEVTAALPPGSGILASAPDAVADLTERVGDAPPYCLIPLPLYAAEDSDTSVWRYDRQTRESVSEAVEGRLVSHALHGDAEPDVAAHFFGAGAPRPASAASLAQLIVWYTPCRSRRCLLRRRRCCFGPASGSSACCCASLAASAATL